MDGRGDPARDRTAGRPPRAGRVRRDRRPTRSGSRTRSPSSSPAWSSAWSAACQPASPRSRSRPSSSSSSSCPGLVFEAAYRLRLDELRRWFGGLALLAVPGVLISAAVVAVVLNLGDRPPLGPRVPRRRDGLGDRPGGGRRDIQARCASRRPWRRWSTARASSTTARVSSCSRSRSRPSSAADRARSTPSSRSSGPWRSASRSGS